MANDRQKIALLEAAPCAVVAFNGSSRIIFVNHKAEQLFGRSQASLLEQSAELLLRDFSLTQATQSAVGVHRTGALFPVTIDMSFVWSADGASTVAVIRVSEEARSSEFKRFIEASVDAIMTRTLDNTIVAWNPTCEKMFGYTSAEASGRAASMLFLPEEIESEDTILALVGKGVAVAIREAVRLRKDGSKIWVSTSISPLRNDTGRVIGAISVERDVTLVKHAHTRYCGLLESAPDGLVVVDANGNIVAVNTQTENLVGCSRNALLNQPVELLVPPRFRLEHVGYRQRFLESTCTRSMGGGKQLYLLRGDDSELPVDISLSPLQSEDGQWVMAALRDVTRRVEIERKLEAACTMAQATTQATSMFLSSMSHEMRTPLTSILGLLQLLENGPLMPEHSRYLSSLKISCEHLLCLINNVLDLSKIESNQLVLFPKRSNAIEIAKESLEMVQPQAQQRGIQISFLPSSTIPPISIDPVRLRQIILNYLTNALKYTNAGQVTLLLNWRDLSGGMLELHVSVSDTGLGIDRESQKLLFRPFSQIDSCGRACDGVGLGLSICQRLAEAMGGRVWVESEFGVGSTFHATMIVPRASSETPIPGSFGQHSEGSIDTPRSPQILLAEDNPINQKLIGNMLEGLGATVEIVSNGQEAVDRLAFGAFDIVFLDINMPVMDGISATHEIRRRFGAHPRIVALTADQNATTVQSCREAGMDDFILKPLSMEDLVNALEKAGISVKRQGKKACPSVSSPFLNGR